MKPKHKKEIEVLLARFENGESSRVEEKRLKEMLLWKENKNNYPEEAALFAYFQTEKNKTEKTAFVETIFENESIQKESFHKEKMKFSILYKYAAILIIALSSLYFTSQYQQDRTKKEEAKMAYLETKKALFIISKEMNNATQKLSKIEDFTEQTQKFIKP